MLAAETVDVMLLLAPLSTGVLALGDFHGVSTQLAPTAAAAGQGEAAQQEAQPAAQQQEQQQTGGGVVDDHSALSMPDLQLAGELALTCYELYRRTPAGLAPEIAHFANHSGECRRAQLICQCRGVVCCLSQAACHARGFHRGGGVADGSCTRSMFLLTACTTAFCNRRPARLSKPPCARRRPWRLLHQAKGRPSFSFLLLSMLPSCPAPVPVPFWCHCSFGLPPGCLLM